MAKTVNVNGIINKAKSASSGNTSSSSSVSNSGEMSTSTQKTGATGAASSTTTIRVQGDPGYSLGQDSEVIRKYRGFMGL